MGEVSVRTTLQVEGHEIVEVAARKFVGLVLAYDQSHDVQNEEKLVWDKSAAGSQDGFTLLVLTCDQPVEVELVSRNGLVERSVMNFSLGKNVPLILSDDTARFDYAGDSFAGQVGEIDLIRLKESNDILGLARLRLWK